MSPVLIRNALALAVALSLGLAACDRNSGAAPATSTTATAAPSADEVKAESARLNAWFDTQYEEQLKFSPIQLSFLGRKDLNDQLDDMSEAGARKQEAWLAASVKAMEAGFDYAKLDPETKLSWDLWKRQHEDARDGLAFLGNGYRFDQMNGAQSFLPTFLINFHKVEDEKDYLAYVSRLQKVGVAFDQLLHMVDSAIGCNFAVHASPLSACG